MPSQSFYLPQLQTTVTQETLAAMDSAVTSLSQLGDYNAIAQVNVSHTLLQNMFQFYTTSENGLDFGTGVGQDPVDLKYRVVWTTGSQPLGIDINSNTTVYDGYMGTATYASSVVALDWTRFLAKQLFNTIEGVDLFSNEETIRSALAVSFSTDLNIKFLALNTATTTDSVNVGVVHNTDNSRNASQVILDQIIHTGAAAARLSTLIESGTTNWYKCPILADDSLWFSVKITAASTQKDLTSVTSVADRTYIIKINATA